MYQGLIKKYEKYLPVTKNTPYVTLLEGNTPLIKSINLSEKLGLNIYFKYDGLNPTGSFKDRGMVMAVAKAIEDGSKAIICASTGNTSAAAAAFAARYNLKCYVLIPDGNIAMGKLAQALMYGAKVISIEGNFDEALDIVRDISNTEDITLVNSVNPYRLQGQKTAAFEVCDDLGKSPDYLAIPIGNAGNISAYWMGFKEYKEDGKINNLPTLLGFQAAGAAPMVSGQVVKNPETIATAIRIGNPASLDKAKKALEESNGQVNAVTDEEILKAYKMLAENEGIFAEPASCTTLAGILKLKEQDYFKGGETVVCVLTGNGLKDPKTSLTQIPTPDKIKATKEAVLKAIGE
ncbi:MAG: threonine synthase [Peptostreptococcaceae bacterium]|jgi:threonine synthase|nr:threonine synthase [Peptostreptococcaceae bacterium]